jgi:hypothetical protein
MFNPPAPTHSVRGRAGSQCSSEKRFFNRGVENNMIFLFAFLACFAGKFKQ